MGKWRVMDCSNSTGSDSNADKDLPPFGASPVATKKTTQFES